MKTYAEKRRDPRWQRKRLEIMERDNFTCRRCGCTDKPLNVHHKIYTAKADPWEYEEAMLLTLCEDCHKAAEDKRNKICRFLGDDITAEHAALWTLHAASNKSCAVWFNAISCILSCIYVETTGKSVSMKDMQVLSEQAIESIREGTERFWATHHTEQE